MEPDEDSILTHLRRGALEYCVLAMLDLAPRYGLDIARTLAAQGVLLTAEGTVYPLLTRLRRNGLLATQWQESSSGPPRRYYTLTADGRAALASFRALWPRFRDAVDGVLGTSAAPGH